MNRCPIILILLVVAAFSLEASHPPIRPPDPTLFELWLIPIFTGRETPGANGSLWTETVFLSNSSTDVVEVIAPTTCGVAGCDQLVIQPLATRQLILGPAYNPARPPLVVYVPRRHSESIQITERVHDLSRSRLNYGTAFSAVRERHLLVGRARLIGLPIADPTHRTTVRVYVPYAPGFDEDGPARAFVLRAYEVGGSGPDRLVGEITFTTAPGHFTNPFTTAYFEIGDLAARMGLAASSTPHRVDVEELSSSPALRFWTFASVTNNDTQAVTVVIP